MRQMLVGGLALLLVSGCGVETTSTPNPSIRLDENPVGPLRSGTAPDDLFVVLTAENEADYAGISDDIDVALDAHFGGTAQTPALLGVFGFGDCQPDKFLNFSRTAADGVHMSSTTVSFDGVCTLSLTKRAFVFDLSEFTGVQDVDADAEVSFEEASKDASDLDAEYDAVVSVDGA